MVKNMKRFTLFLVLILSLFLTSCGSDPKVLNLLKESSDNFLKSTSVRMDIDFDVLFERVNESTGIKMYFMTENTTKPVSGHAVGFSLFDIDGRETGGIVEVYEVKEDNEIYTYSMVNDMWTKEKGDTSKSAIGLKSDYLNPEDKPEKFKLSEETVMHYDKECLELTGELKGDNIMNLFDINVVGELSGIEMPDIEDINKSSFPVVVDIYKETKLPARIYIDMTDVLNEIYGELDDTLTVSKYVLKIEYRDYNKVGEIKVPQEVKDKVENK